DSLAESLRKLKSIVSIRSEEMLRVTCFVRSLDENRDAQRLMSQHFPNAALNYVQTQREYLPPVAACEGVARASAVGGNSRPAEGYSWVTAPEVVLSATQLSFGTQEC